MKLVFQRIFHNPPESYGDCHRAAVATLLGLEYEEVPHFMDGIGDDETPEFYARENQFLQSRGLDRITFPVQAESLEQACAAAAEWNPGRFFLLGVCSKNGNGHTVVAGACGVEHDPNPLSPGINGPMRDGYFWVTYILGARR